MPLSEAPEFSPSEKGESGSGTRSGAQRTAYVSEDIIGDHYDELPDVLPDPPDGISSTFVSDPSLPDMVEENAPQDAPPLPGDSYLAQW